MTHDRLEFRVNVLFPPPIWRRVSATLPGVRQREVEVERADEVQPAGWTAS
jgi:hypothetical protein